MSRGLTTDMANAIAQDAVQPLHLVEIHYSGATVFYTDTYRAIVYGGATYQANGVLLDTGAIDESLKLEVQSVDLTLTTVPQAVLAEALTNNYLNRLVVIRKGLLDSAEQLVVDPVSVFRGLLSNYKFSEDPDSGDSTLTWTAQDEFSDFQRVTGRRTNDADQQLYFSGDRGFEFAAQKLTDLKWGRA